MSTLRSAVKLSIFTVLTLAATTLLALTITNYSGLSTAGYHAVFSDASNLVSGDEVRDAGVRVGTVSGVSLVHGSQAEVDFSLMTGVHLTSTTTVVIRYLNLIGQRYLAIVDGAPGGRVLPVGATVTRTQDALNLTTLFNGFQPLLQGLSPGDVNQLSYDIVQVLQGEGGAVDSMLGQVGSVTNTLADHDALIGSVISDLNNVLGPVTSHDAQLSSLLNNLQQFVSGLSDDRHAIGNSLTSIDNLVTTTRSLVARARPALAADVDHLGQLAEKLDTPQSQRLLRHFLSYTPFKLKVSTPEASYGAFLNFYVCGVNFIMPNGSKSKEFINSAHRCHA
jgi:phospholipid/cholesterol/gamma-HCH transport system substrate-binding protein